MAIRRYDANEITIILGGKILDGYGDDGFVEIEHDEDAWGKAIGVNGTGARYKINNKGANIKITVQHTAPINDYFMALYTADDQSGTGASTFLLNDELGTSKFSSPGVWVKKLPNYMRGRTVGNVEWNFDCITMSAFIGGND